MSATKEAPKALTRPLAAEWFQQQGFTHITELLLRKWAVAGKGPQYHTLGRFVYYRPDDLQSWLEAELKPATKGRTAPRRH